MFIATRLSAALFEATALSALAEEHDEPRKVEGPALNGESQDVAMEDLHVDSNGIHLEPSPPPPAP